MMRDRTERFGVSGEQPAVPVHEIGEIGDWAHAVRQARGA